MHEYLAAAAALMVFTSAAMAGDTVSGKVTNYQSGQQCTNADIIDPTTTPPTFLATVGVAKGDVNEVGFTSVLSTSTFVTVLLDSGVVGGNCRNNTAEKITWIERN